MRYFLLVFFATVLLFYCQPVYAQSDYVLPYPSSMPGSKLYKVHLVWEELMKYWYFGDFGQFLYNLKQSDKYLVESKTLFEYKQYLLGYIALKKSDAYFRNINDYLLKAQENGKNITKNSNLLKNASLKHIEILNKMGEEVPENFNWQPEKKASSDLHLREEIDKAIKLRKTI